MGLLTGFRAKLKGKVKSKKTEPIVCVNYRTHANFDEPKYPFTQPWPAQSLNSQNGIGRSLQQNSSRNSPINQPSTSRVSNFKSPETSFSRAEKIVSSLKKSKNLLDHNDNKSNRNPKAKSKQSEADELPRTNEATNFADRNHSERQIQRFGETHNDNTDGIGRSLQQKSSRNSPINQQSTSRVSSFKSPETLFSRGESIIGSLKKSKKLLDHIDNKTNRNSKAKSKQSEADDRPRTNEATNFADHNHSERHIENRISSFGETHNHHLYNSDHYEETDDGKSTLIFMTESHDNSKKSSREEDNGECNYIPETIERTIEVKKYLVEFPFEQRASNNKAVTITVEDEYEKCNGKIETSKSEENKNNENAEYFLPHVEDEGDYKVNIANPGFYKNREQEEETDEDIFIARKSYRMLNGITFSSQASSIFFGGEDEFEKSTSVNLKSSDNLSNSSSISA